MTNDGKSKQGKAKQEPQVLPNSLVGIDWHRIYTGRPPTMCPQCHEMDVPYTCIHAETAVSGRISVGSCSQKKDKSVWYARRVGSIALLVFIRVYIVSSAVFDYLRLDRLMWLPDARYLRTPSSLIALGSQADRQKANESSFAIIKPCYTQKRRPSSLALSWPRLGERSRQPLTLACRRRRGSVNYGADQVPMTCIHDCHLHAATLIRRTYMEFGDATGCSISNPLPLGSPEAAPKRICAHYRGTARYLATATIPTYLLRHRRRGVGQIKIGMLPHSVV